MTIEDIKRLIANDESRVLELKKSTGELAKGMQTLCAFLNADGGWLFFGITPKLEIVGQNVTDSTQREIAHEITKIEAAIRLPLEIVEVPGHPDCCVIGIHAEAAKFGDAPYTYDGRAYYKVESTTVLMPRSMFEERLRRSDPSRFAWESQTPSFLHLEDLDENMIRKTIMYGISKGRMPATSASEDTMTLLDKFAMVENGKIKNAAAALFTKRPQDYPQFLLRMARFRGNEKRDFVDNMRLSGNFFELLDAGLAFLFKHLNQSGVVKGIRREEQLEIPVEALREALTNALCHRQFDSPSGSVGIAIYDDRVEIENAGHLPNELTVETIKQPHRSYPQNPIIANALYMTAYLESWGTGVSRMIDACKTAGVPEPKYSTDGLFVWITFKRPNLDTYLDTNLDTNSDSNLDTNASSDIKNKHNNTNNQSINSDSNSDSNPNTYSDSNPNTNPNTNSDTKAPSDIKIQHNNTNNQSINSDTNPNTYSDSNPNTNLDTNQMSDRQKEVLRYCIFPRSSREIMDHIHVTYHNKNIAKYITSLIEAGFLERTIPNSAFSPNQKYVTKIKI
ncbi:MAG: putative DNA binding domain-containing protein [Bacteroidales bacterium]|nr:putative DNA binding domain-containing protein [Bacteroidales bacterium]